MRASGAAAQTPNRYVLENEKLRVEIDASNGTITRLSDKQGQIDLVPADGLADNFHLLLCDAEKRQKMILGRKQKLSPVSKPSDGLELTWNGPLADTEGGSHPIRTRMEIRLADSGLEFRFFLQNDTQYKVAQVWYPVIGGLLGFGRGQARGEALVMMPISGASINKLALPLAHILALSR